MIVDAVLEPGIAFSVRAGLALEHDRAAVRQDQAVPDEQHAALAEADAVIVLADEAGRPAAQAGAARRAVIDVLRHLRGDLARQVGADAGDERGRDDGARLEHIGRRGRGDAIGRDGAAVGGRIEEGELPILRGRRGRLRSEAEPGEVRHGGGLIGRSCGCALLIQPASLSSRL